MSKRHRIGAVILALLATFGGVAVGTSSAWAGGASGCCRASR